MVIKNNMKLNNKAQNNIIWFIAFVSVFIPAMAYLNHWYNSEEIIVSASYTPSITLTPSPTEQKVKEFEVVGNEYIRLMIKEVFKEDYDKAMLLLTGNGKCGGENGNLNPKAVNTAGNTPKGSRDIGVFQINEYWQDVNAKFLFDPEINIRIAHKIYRDSGNTFKMWSGGKCQGI